MIINVALPYLPYLYKDSLDAYVSGRPVPFKQLTGSGGVNKLLRLYDHIKRSGYGQKPYIFGEVENGYLLIRGGYHRLSVLHKLGYKSVSVQLRSYDTRFERFYQIMLGLQKQGEIMYHPLDHWALSTWQVERGKNRFALVKKHLSPGSVLDLGCYTGYFSNALACHGHHVTGVDHSDDALFCAEYLADYYQSRNAMLEKWPLELGHLSSLPKFEKPTFIKSDVLTYLQKAEDTDYSLFFSVYRWLDDPKAVVRLLGEKTRLGIFADVKAGYEKELVRAVTTLTPFTEVRNIGIENGMSKNYRRGLFLFSRQ